MLENYLNNDKIEVGVDEAGYGSFYGRVYAAAVIWPHDFNHELIRDSKRLNPHKRDEAYELVINNAIAYAVCYREPSVIDRVNIRQANFQAMHEAIDKLGLLPDTILVDGNAFIPYMDRLFEPVDCQLITKGDNKYCAIAAASILAKVSRDRYIFRECARNPLLSERYCLDKNKGYGALVHREGLRKWGATDGHRKKGFTEKYTNKIEEIDEEKSEDK